MLPAHELFLVENILYWVQLGRGDSIFARKLTLSIISWVNAGVIGHLINFTPVSVIYTTLVICGRTIGESAGDFDPALLEISNSTEKSRQLAKILILAKDKSDIELGTVCCIQNLSLIHI